MNQESQSTTILISSSDETILERAYLSSTWRIIPLLSLLWLLAWVDRANVAFAKLQMLSELHFNEAVYGFGAGMFFIGYSVFVIPSILSLQKFGARRVIATLSIGWGVTSLGMMFVRTPLEFYLLRFLLGSFEAGFYPGVILYLTYWFPGKRRTRNFSIFHSAAICSTVVVGLTGAVVLQNMNGFGGLAGWRWMFLIQSIPTIMLGCLAALVLADRPASAKWLSSEQKHLVDADLRKDGAQVSESKEGPWAQLFTPIIWKLILVYFCVLCSNAALAFFIPSILKQAGFGGYASIGNALAVICILGAVVSVGISFLASRTGLIRWFSAGAALLTVASLLALVFVWHDNRAATFAALVLALGGTGAGISLFWYVPPRLLDGKTAAVGIAFISMFANLAGFFTPWLTGLTQTVTGHYTSSFVAIACIQALAAVLILTVIPATYRGKRLTGH
ncbi:MAG TPA: MFS transporter [Rhizomicrobium sp.]|nr:MFS transporter [Rhizomicrobium sp.]